MSRFAALFMSILVLVCTAMCLCADDGSRIEPQKHWAYVAPSRPTLPKVHCVGLPHNQIDHFTLARMAVEGFEPSHAATRQQWLRRATFDLTGLPPSLDEIDRFLSDSSPTAFDRVVDRLLASPRYGERMGLHWLDLARYADTHGFHADAHRDMWRWREWVIDSLNDNLPFDQFTVWQIAGDLLPNATLEQRIATGFNRNHMINFEGGAIAEEFQTEYVVDRVVTTSTVWLGQTMLCARCHDHKYDPFTQRDFFSLYAYFNNISEEGLDGRKGNAVPYIRTPTRGQQSKLHRLVAKIARAQENLQDRAANAVDDQKLWERNLVEGVEPLPGPPSDVLLHYPLDETAGTRVSDVGVFEKHGEVEGRPFWTKGKFENAFVFGPSIYIAVGDAAAFERTDKFSCGAWVAPTTSDEMAVLARMDDDADFQGYDLHLHNGKVGVSLIHRRDDNAIRVKTTESIIRGYDWQHVMMICDGSGKASGIKIYVDGKSQKLEVEQDNLDATIKTDKPLHLGRRNASAPFRGTIDDVRFYARELSATDVALIAGSNPLAEIISIPTASRTDSQQSTLRNYFLEKIDLHYQALKKHCDRLEREQAEVEKTVPTTMVMQEREQPRETFVLDGGDYRYETTKVTPATPAILPALASAPKNRLGLAQWLVDPQNPLTARVTVNRFWQMYFGDGLVRTPEDFGTRGELPTHPELLDWLAVEFVESGWDVKHMQKLIVLSATYRQSSRVSRQQLAKDRMNRLIARGPRSRLDAEFIRDQALEVSGLLTEQIGGKSVYPYQPPGLWKEISFNPLEFTAQVYVQSRGEDLYRRGVYSFWKRSVPPPSMSILGAPDREVCTVRRPRPSTPLDALVLMNDPTFIEAARGLARRMMREAGPDYRERIAHGFRLATSRRCTPAELDVLADNFLAELKDFKSGNSTAMQLLNVGESSRDESLDVSEYTAYTIIASMILNLHETITKS